eukprot:COSAG02_NODE_10720_length_1874_cov_1.176901_2_plen_150_part_01
MLCWRRVAVMADPAKACVPILKEAAKLDAKLKAGDETVKGECVRLYTEGLEMLEAAVSAGSYSEKVTVALDKKSTAVRKRLDVLGTAPGHSPRAVTASAAKKAKRTQGSAATKAGSGSRAESRVFGESISACKLRNCAASRAEDEPLLLL